MGLAGSDVLPVEVPVEIDRDIDPFHDGIGTRRKATAPHRVAHDALSWRSLATLLLRHRDSPIMTGPQNTARSQAIRRLAVVLAGGVLGVAVGLAGVYGIARLAGNVAVDTACKP